MIKKPLLKIIHFAILFIIGVLFTIFLSKIKTAISIEKFNPFTGINRGVNQVIKGATEIVQATDITVDNPLAGLLPENNNNNSAGATTSPPANVQTPEDRILGPGVKVKDNTVLRAKECERKTGTYVCGKVCTKLGPVQRCWGHGRGRWCYDYTDEERKSPNYCQKMVNKRCNTIESARWIKKANDDAECGWEKWYDLCDKNADQNKPCEKKSDDGKCYRKIQTNKTSGSITVRKWGSGNNTPIYIKPPTNIECEKTILCDCPVDCKGIPLPCSINCETGSNRFIVTQEAVAGGSPCDYPSDCEDGDGACDSNRLKTVGSGGSWPDKISSIDELNRARQLIIPPWVGHVMPEKEWRNKSLADYSDLAKIHYFEPDNPDDDCVNIHDDANNSNVGSYVYKVDWEDKTLYKTCKGFLDEDGNVVSSDPLSI